MRSARPPQVGLVVRHPDLEQGGQRGSRASSPRRSARRICQSSSSRPMPRPRWDGRTPPHSSMRWLLALAGDRLEPAEGHQLRAVPHEHGVRVGMRPHRCPLVGQVLELVGLAVVVDRLHRREQVDPRGIVLAARRRPTQRIHAGRLPPCGCACHHHSMDPSSLTTIRYDTADGVATITLDRADRHNAFTSTMCDEMAATWAHIREDRDVRSVVLTAAGDKAFCTGIDRSEVPVGGGGRVHVRPVHLRGSRRPPRAPRQRVLEAGGGGRQRHGLRRRLLPPRRGRHHHRGGARHVLRPPRHLRRCRRCSSRC